MNLSHSLFHFQFSSRSCVQWIQYHLNSLSLRMQSNQTIATAVFVIANSYLFAFQTIAIQSIENVIWQNQDSEKIAIKKVTYQSLLFQSALTGISTVAFNILLSRLINFSLNAWMLTAITICALTARLLFLKFKEASQIQEKLIFKEISKHCEVTPDEDDYLWLMEAKNEDVKSSEKLFATYPLYQSKIQCLTKKFDEKVSKQVEEKSEKKIEDEEKAIVETKRLIKKVGSYKIDQELKLLACSVIKGEEIEPFICLKHYWETKCVKHLKNRHEFVQLFGSDVCVRFQAVRKVFAPLIYQKLPLHKQLQWLSPAEVQRELQKSFVKDIDKLNCSVFGTGYYYHSTNLQGLEGILTSGQLEVRARAFKGAFVSTSPFVFGHPYVFVFKKTIEHLSTLFHGFFSSDGKKDYWAGFSHHIPINEQTLAHILVKKYNAEKSELEIEALCEKWAKRKIKVIGEVEYCTKWKPRIEALGMGIPNYWIDELHQNYVSTEKVEIVNIE